MPISIKNRRNIVGELLTINSEKSFFSLLKRAYISESIQLSSNK